MVLMMNNFPIDSKPSVDPLSFFPIVPTLESPEPPITKAEKPCSHGDSSAYHVPGEINREIDEASKNMEDRTVSGYQSSSSVHGSSGSRFQHGDMVWGKVKSHPWWPGHLFNEAFASAAVRRIRRDGHVLVAFFGDSSYGWFDLDDLIPFEPHFAEKSKQTSSRNFMKAVEEAMDEASRRRALGLTCYCRNSNNFRPTNVPGYVAVDVAGYDSGGVYSAEQIEEARASFRPVELISFIQGLALSPQDSDQSSIDSIKTMATVLAYRRAVFEEYDETYAQAFGVERVCPSRDSSGQLEQLPTRISRAPLSGPLVIAEALGDGFVRSSKPIKAKDSTKKDKYLLKRRDESISQRLVRKDKPDIHVDQTKPDVSSSFPADIKRDSDSGGYLRTPPIEEKQPVQKIEQRQLQIKDHGKKAQDRQETAHFTGSGNRKPVDSKLGSVDGNAGQIGVDLPANFRIGSEDVGSTGKAMEKPETNIDDDVNATGQVVPEAFEGDEAVVADLGDSSKVEISGVFEPNLVDFPVDLVAKKVKAKALEQKEAKKKEKRKKKERDSILETKMVHSLKRQKLHQNEEPAKKVDGESKEGGSVHLDRFHTDSQKGPSFSVSAKIGRKVEPIQLPELLGNLLALALDPFHGSNHNYPVRKVFLKFRSLVYQKSLVLDGLENVASRSSSNSAVLESGAEGVLKKKAKPVSKFSEKLSGKRSHPDQEDELSEKRQKKLNELKSIALGKKSGEKIPPESGQKNLPESQRDERKETVSLPVQAKSVKPTVPSPVKAQPVILIMKFPKGTALPSISQLKAMFIRFGPLDHSRTRVFYDSGTCKVVFRQKPDASAAYDYATRNNMFGQARVVYYLREIQVVPPPETREVGKRRVDDTGREFSGEARPLMQYQQRSAVQLKSCLKKPVSEVAGVGSIGVVKESQRVKFLLGGEESRRVVSLVGSSNNASADAPPSPPPPPPPSIGLDVSTNVKMVSPPLLPLLNSYHSSALGESSHNLSTQIQANFREVEGKKSVDISHQFMILLLRMNDIVSEVRGALGYVPYHPL